MSTTTPPEPPRAARRRPGGYTGLGRTPRHGAILPVPGNAELAIWLLVEVVLAIVAAASATASTRTAGRSRRRG